MMKQETIRIEVTKSNLLFWSLVKRKKNQKMWEVSTQWTIIVSILIRIRISMVWFHCEHVLK